MTACPHRWIDALPAGDYCQDCLSYVRLRESRPCGGCQFCVIVRAPLARCVKRQTHVTTRHQAVYRADEGSCWEEKR